MKNLTKIFMAVMAGMLAFSCVTDITEDQAVQLGADQVTTIGLSLESDVRTHITGKDGNNEYPMYWSKDDKIAVNGKASEPLAEEYHGEQQAQFTVNALLGYPRAIVYPAPAEGVQAATAGNYPVTFAATQAYTAGTFAEGAAPMYAYQSSSSNVVTLNHLAGVLRLAPYGNATLKALVITAENGKLAGNFDVDTEGNLTAHADATNSVTVTFGEGLALTNKETPIYVAVPAGDYGSVSVTLITDKDSMSMRFNTSGENENGEPKAIKAGKVREFAAFEYVASSDTAGDFFIYDEASLLNFAKNAATIANAKVVADIDMTGKSWTAVDNYEGVFDGGNFKIKGLKAPLFGETTKAVTIKNVHLTDVDITISKSLYAGAIALHINNAASLVENCSAEGKLSVAGELKDATSSTFFGGCFGRIENATIISKITNKVDVTIEFSTVHTGTGFIYIGGCVGLGDYVGIEECHNYGDIQVTDVSYSYIYAGGVVSAIRSQANRYMNLSNDGDITVNAKRATAHTFVGGICAQHYSSILEGKHINTGDITVTGDSYALGIFISGVTGYPKEDTHILTITDAEFSNSGTLTWSGTVTNSTVPNLHMSGIFTGSYGKFTGTAKSIVNTGDLICRGSIGAYAHIGGIVTGRNKSAFNSNSAYDNLENAKCYCKIQAIDKGEKCYIGMLSSVAYSPAAAFKNSSVGGSIQTTADDEGKLTLDNYMQYLYRQGSTISEGVIANIDKIGWLENDDINSTPQYKEVAGIEIGSADELLKFAADVTANPTLVDVVVITDNIDMTGVEWTPIVGFAGSFNGRNHTIKGLNDSLFGITQAAEIKNVVLTDVAIEQSHTVGLYFGALARVVENTEAQISNCKASGKIDLTLPATASDYFTVGGLIGKTTTTTALTGLVNEVDVSVTVNLAGQVMAAGCLGSSDTASLDNCQNLGNIYVGHEAKGTTTGIAYNCLMGGLAGQCCNVTNCTNGSATDPTKGKVHYAAYHYGTGGNRNFYVGGVTAVCKAGSTVASNCKNYGEIKVSNASVNNSSSHMRVAGIIGEACHITESISDCENHGPINVDMDLKSARSYFTVAGIANDGNYGGTSFGQFSTVSNCYNYGKITLDGASVRPNLQLGGIFNVMGGTNRTYTNVKNYGDIELKNTKLEKTLNLGGVAGIYKSGTLNGVSNEGDIIISETTITDVENSYVGGVFGSIEAPVSNVRCFCDIQAVGFTNIGMITGSARNAANPRVKNCAVGGSICTRIIGEGESGRPDVKYLSATNYFNYIYSSADWDGVTDYDGCTFDSTVVALPE